MAQIFFNHLQIENFKRSYPCSGIPTLSGITFEFDSHGNLCDIVALDWETGLYTDSSEFDGAGLLALAQDAREAIRARCQVIMTWPNGNNVGRPTFPSMQAAIWKFDPFLKHSRLTHYGEVR